MFAIELAHHAPMPIDEILHAIGAIEQLVGIVRREIERIAFSRGSAVIVQRPTPDFIHRGGAFFRQTGEEAAGPIVVGAVGTGGDERKRLVIGGGPGREFAEFNRVLRGGHFAAAAPALITHAPVANVERIRRSVGRAAHGGDSCVRGGVAVLDPFIEIAGGHSADIGGDIRLRADQAAEAHELIRCRSCWGRPWRGSNRANCGGVRSKPRNYGGGGVRRAARSHRASRKNRQNSRRAIVQW